MLEKSACLLEELCLVKHQKQKTCSRLQLEHMTMQFQVEESDEDIESQRTFVLQRKRLSDAVALAQTPDRPRRAFMLVFSVAFGHSMFSLQTKTSK